MLSRGIGEVMEARRTMAILNRLIGAAAVVFVSAGAAHAQVTQVQADQIRMRQQIATMETILERAIVTGAENVMAQVRRVISDRPRLGQARASGFRLPDVGVIFNVQVPEMFLPMMYHVVVRERQETDMLMRIQQLQNEATQMPPGEERNQRLQQVVRLQQDLALGNLRPSEPRRGMVGPQSLVPSDPSRTEAKPIADTDVDDPESAYTRHVKAALIDAMLTNSQALGIRPEESLVIVARDAVPNNPQFPGDSIDSSIWVMRVKGSVLAAYQRQSITLEAARKQVEVTEQ